MAIYSDNLKNLLTSQKIEPLKNLTSWQQKTKKDIQENFNELEKLKFKDIDWRLKNRQSIRNFFFFLLVLQNLVVFLLFGIGLWFNKLAGLEGVFNVLIGGTLTETASLIYIIVKWLFSEIPYKEQS
ncbi:hypothetical protein HY025_02985 [Candidatus Daviesbacteria bacterium]|nr:hypothetical protein [Candidatus Daviesbacteria bacterium]